MSGRRSASGWLGVVVVLACVGAVIGLAYTPVRGLIAIPILIGLVVAASLIIVQPGQTPVVRFFGSYVGTVRASGLRWILPLADRRSLSIRVRNFETNHLKVNDADGNPVEIAAIVVWQVADTPRAVYAVDDYVNFVRSRPSRRCATSPPRTPTTTRPATARRCAARPTSSPPSSRRRVAQRVAIAGVEIVEVRISHLAYASEIAQAMLRRQQANAVVAARSRIVEGAVGMVEQALDRAQRARHRRPRRGT